MKGPTRARDPAKWGAVQGALVFSMAIWGLNVPVVKQLTGAFDALWLAALRMLVAVAALSAVLFWKRLKHPRVGAAQIAAIALCGVLMVYLNQILFAEGLFRSTATNGALIMALSPLISAILGAMVFKERMSTQRIVGVALGFAGVSAVVLSHPGAGLSQASVGDLMLIGGVVSFATGGALVQKLAQRLDPIWISWAIYLVGASLLLVHALSTTASVSLAFLFPGWWVWSLILFSGIMATALSNLVWNGAIARIGVARTAVFLYLVPVFGVGFAAVLLGERLNAWHFGGFLAVLVGTYLGTRKPSPAPTLLC